MNVDPVKPGPGQESVWDYPRPPRIEPFSGRILVIFGGQVVADTSRAVKYMETSHPPTYYIPRSDVKTQFLLDSPKVTVCEFKGGARYHSLRVGDRLAEDAAWFYPKPKAPFEAIEDHLAFYPQKMDECSIDGEVVQPQPGKFYGGWVTSKVVGPFKGGPGTLGW